VVLAGLGSGDSGEASKPPPRPLGHVSWIVSGADLAMLRSDNAGLARRFFDNGETFVLGSSEGTQDLVPRGYRSIPTLSYTSLRAFESDVHFGTIDPSIAAIVYDPESWAATPAAERAHPKVAMARFTALASRWGFGPILAPGRDLALAGSACSKQPGELLDQAYLRCGLTAGAIDAENFVVQAAPEELALERLHGLLKSARKQLRARAPATVDLASLSTDPPGGEKEVWPVDLVRAARLELKHFPGIMFNFTPATADLAASFLRDLEREGPIGGMLVSRRD
jgi:hypothetical protein